MAAVLGAGGVLAAVLSAAGPAALAQPAFARALTLPKACVAIEALVSDGVSGPGLGGEVLRVSPGGQSTLTTNSSPAGSPPLDLPSDMAFLPNGDIVITDVDGTTGNPQLLRITPATGGRVVLSGNGVGSGPTLTGAAVGLQGGVIYLMDYAAGQIMSVNAGTGARTLVSGPTRGSGPNFVMPTSMTSDSATSVVVLDMERPSGTGKGLGALIRVDLATGNRTVLSDDVTPSGGQQFDTPSDVAYNACENAFYVLQTGFTPGTPPGKVLKVDATTGATLGVRTLFAKYQGAENYALLLRPALTQLPGGGGGGGD